MRKNGGGGVKPMFDLFMFASTYCASYKKFGNYFV